MAKQKIRQSQRNIQHVADENEVTLNKNLQIVTCKNQVLSKNQKTFNKLTSEISRLQKLIETTYNQNELLLNIYSEKITPLENKETELKIEIAKALSKQTEIQKYSKKQLENIGEAISFLLDEVFRNRAADEETIALYNKWAEVSYEEEMEKQKAEVGQMFKEMTGMDVNIDDFMNEESVGEAAQKLREDMENKKQKEKEEWERKQKNKKKSTKQLEAEMAKELEEKQTLKSIRNIYISLAKTLHPDTETEPDKKAEKEELMKKVTAAYNNKDITTLFKLEMEWVNLETRNIENLTEEKLKLYNNVLKEQLQDLRTEYNMLIYNPRYEDIEEFISLTPKQALKTIENIKNEKELETEEMLSQVNILNNAQVSKKIVNEITKEILAEKGFDQVEDFLDFIMSGGKMNFGKF